MKKNIKNPALLLLALFLFSPALASAHQPRLVTNQPVVVTQPEISKAYYARLAGSPQLYLIHAAEPFDLYLNVLVPDIAGQKKDIAVVVLKNGKQLAFLDGLNFEWKKFFEPFGHDTYWMGPEYKAKVEAGEYQIFVSSANNDSKYSLAVGQTEAFDAKEGLNALVLIPQLKRNFFNESPANFILSPFGYGEIIILYLLAAIAGLIYRSILKKVAKSSERKVTKNIDRQDRLIRSVIGAGLLLWAITTTWNPLLLFFSGFAFFEAIFSWCGFYAALGKNTCPI